MKKSIIIFSIVSFLCADNDIYTKDYYFQQKKSALLPQAKEIIENTNSYPINTEIAKENKVISSNTKVKEKPNKKRQTGKIVKAPNKCDVIAQMQSKTYYNPRKNEFFINGVSYEILPKDFKNCGFSFVAVRGAKDEVFFELSDKRVLEGKINISGDDIDDNFFFLPNAEQTLVAEKTSPKQSIVNCDFELPYGIRTALNDNNDIIHLPKAYKNKKVIELYFEKSDEFVYVSNGGFPKIKISLKNFQENCKTVK